MLRNGEGPLVLVRADMDGLPVKEDTGLPYASTAAVETPTATSCRSCTPAGTTCTSPRWSARRSSSCG